MATMKKLRKTEKLYMNVTVTEDIQVTNHAIQRHGERNLYGCNDREKLKEDIIAKIRKSRLFNIKDGAELREYHGSIFVCKREIVKGIAKMVVITELLATPKKLEYFGKSYI